MKINPQILFIALLPFVSACSSDKADIAKNHINKTSTKTMSVDDNTLHKKSNKAKINGELSHKIERECEHNSIGDTICKNYKITYDKNGKETKRVLIQTQKSIHAPLQQKERKF